MKRRVPSGECPGAWSRPAWLTPSCHWGELRRRSRGKSRTGWGAEMQLSQTTFRELAGRIQEMCGLELGPEKLYLVRNRLEPVVRLRKLASFEELARRLGTADLTLRREVIEAITTHETAFFRDGHPFETIRTHLL